MFVGYVVKMDEKKQTLYNTYFDWNPRGRNFTNYYGFQMSSEKKPGWLGYKRDYTTQLYRDYIYEAL